MASGGLEDILFGQLEGYEEEEENEDDNLGRISAYNKTEIKNENQLTKYGLEIGGKKRKKSSHDNNIKSSGDILQNSSSKDILEQVANSVEDNNLENNQGNQINININNSGSKKEDNLTINSNNIQIPKINKENNLEISNNNNIINININNSPKEKPKEGFSMSKSNNIKLDEKTNNINLNNNKNNLSLSLNKNNLEISSQNKATKHFKSVSQSQITIEQIQMKRLSTKSKKALIENNNYDYYSLFHEDYVLRKLKELKDQANENNIYSDQIFLLTNGKKLEKRLILLLLLLFKFILFVFSSNLIVFDLDIEKPSFGFSFELLFILIFIMLLLFEISKLFSLFILGI